MSETQSILPLKLSDVSVRKRGKTILENINLELGSNGITIVMGPNGSGKTTLLRLMHGLLPARTGTVEWAAAQQSIAQAEQALVFQTPIMMRRSVVDNIAYPLLLRGIPKSQAKAEAERWVETIGLSGRQGSNATHLSGGERQKLAIARALILKPQVLFLDEPTTNLDGQSTREIEALLLNAHKDGARIVMATHDIGQAKRLAHDVIFLNKGRLETTESSATFFGKPKSLAARAYLKGDIVE